MTVEVEPFWLGRWSGDDLVNMGLGHVAEDRPSMGKNDEEEEVASTVSFMGFGGLGSGGFEFVETEVRSMMMVV